MFPPVQKEVKHGPQGLLRELGEKVYEKGLSQDLVLTILRNGKNYDLFSNKALVTSLVIDLQGVFPLPKHSFSHNLKQSPGLTQMPLTCA